MYPELFKIPFIHLSVPGYGLMMVIGFLAAISLIRHLSSDITPDPQLITNAALYSLIAGVVGARLFYVVHHFDQFEGRLLSVFAIWQGGLELLGGVILAITVILFYLRRHKLPIRRYLDILAIGLMLALVFGRVGCLLNGCCFGKPTNLPWAVRFPYHSSLHVHSPAYRSQVYPNLKRNRSQPQLKLPADFFSSYGLKPYDDLTDEQKYMVDKGPYRCLPVHPTQLYSSLSALLLCLILYAFWRRSSNIANPKSSRRFFAKSGCTFGLMFILYGLTRFSIEFLRDDNPFEFDSLTISQNISIAMVVFGIILTAVLGRLKPDVLAISHCKRVAK